MKKVHTPLILVTGGAGFIGSALVRHLIETTTVRVLNVDKLTYAGNLQSLSDVSRNPRYRFVRANICRPPAVSRLFRRYRPDGVIHLAAETHVDRSIFNPEDFIQTNVVGTFVLLEQVRRYWEGLSGGKKKRFRILHVSTDEVYGSLGMRGRFEESSPYQPRSPYSASKAASDHLARAWFHTYGLPVLVTNSSNNFGPYQYPEKMIALMIINAIQEKPLPVYGRGLNVRDWLYVDDHARALWWVFNKGRPGETYNIGASSEKRNIDVVRLICRLLDRLRPRSKPHASLIRFVTDRPGHDLRYALDAQKIRRELGWKPRFKFEEALESTILWYLDHPDWVRRVQTGAYRTWIEKNYRQRGNG